MGNPAPKQDGDNLDGPLTLAEGVYWVGLANPPSGFHCNPYLLVEGKRAVVIDGGSRPDFSTVMRKILQTGVSPEAIHALIYQHYDPDLCGSLPNFVDIIGPHNGLTLISKKENNPFIRHYALSANPVCIDDLDRTFMLGPKRRLRFIPTPYAHSPGSFMTLDEANGVLFTSDLFGALSLGKAKRLRQNLEGACIQCGQPIPRNPQAICQAIDDLCPLSGLFAFHRQVMPSNAALRHALAIIRDIDPRVIAPQHGAVWERAGDTAEILRRLMELDDIGIDGVLGRGHG